MFGISLQPDDKNDEDKQLSEAINTISDKLSNSTKSDGIKFIIGFLFIFVLFIFILCLLFFGFFSLSAFAWNSSFAVLLNLPVMSWLNMAFGYIFVYIVYRMLRTMW